MVFRPGPVFTQLLLADEINRTPPKTQAALLEAIGEDQVSVDGQTRALPSPFIVLALFQTYGVAGVLGLIIALLMVSIVVVAVWGIEPARRGLEDLETSMAKAA